MQSRAEMYPASYISEIALLIALACVLGLVERLLSPAAFIPGIRLGLGNLAILVALVRHGARAAAVVTLGKIVITGLAFGTMMSPIGLMSVVGGTAAWIGMAGLSRAGGRFSTVGLSIAGSAGHALGQLGAAAFLSSTLSVLSLAPLLLVASLPTGIAVGLTARLLSSHISRPVLSAAEG